MLLSKCRKPRSRDDVHSMISSRASMVSNMGTMQLLVNPSITGRIWIQGTRISRASVRAPFSAITSGLKWCWSCVSRLNVWHGHDDREINAVFDG